MCDVDGWCRLPPDADSDGIGHGSRYLGVHGVGSDYWIVGATDADTLGVVVNRRALDFVRADVFEARLTAVWANAPDDVWAAGDDIVVHWDGANWERAGPSERGFARDIWSSGGGDVWLVRGGMLLHRVDGAWQTVHPEAEIDASSFTWLSVTGTAADDVWITGGTAGYWTNGDLYVGHWDGERWSTTRVGRQAHSHPVGLWARIRATERDDVWLAGVLAENADAMHFDGIEWRGLPDWSIGDISGASRCDVWFLTADGPSRWDGATLHGPTQRGRDPLSAIWNGGNGRVVETTPDGTVLLRGW